MTGPLRAFHQFRQSFLRRPSLVVGSAAVLFFLCLMSYGLESRVQVSDMIEGDSPVIAQYRAHVSEFPRHKNLLGVVELSSGTWSDPLALMRFREWTHARLFADTRLQHCLTPLDPRELVFDASSMQLTFPLIVSETGELGPVSWEKLRASPWGSFFVGRDQKTLIFNCQLKDEMSGAQIEALVADLRGGDDFRVRLSGDAVFDAFAERGLAKMQWLNILALLGLGVLIFLLFRSWSAVVIAMISMLLGIGSVLGLMAIFGYSLDLLTSNLFMLLLLASIEDLFLVFYFSARKGLSLREASDELLVPSFFTSLTTAIGFGSLGLSDVPVIQRFALWSSLGVMLEWFLVFHVTPYLWRSWPALRLQPGWLFVRITGLATAFRLPRFLSLSMLLPLLLVPFLFSKLNYNADPFELFPSGHEVVSLRSDLRQSRGWENFLELHFEGHPSVAVKRELLGRVRELPNIVWIEEPSLFLNVPVPTGVSVTETELTDLAHTQFRQSGLGARYRSLDSERAFIYIEKSDMESVAAVTAALQSVCHKDCFVTGELVALGDYSRLIIKTLSESLVTSIFSILALILGLMWFLRVREWKAVTLSILWGQGLLLWIFVLTQTSVSLLSCILLSTVAGISGDNAIQFIFNARNGDLNDSVEEIGPSAALMAFVIVCLGLPWLFSDFGNVREIGGLLILSLFLMLFGDYVLLRGLVSSKKS